MGFFDILVHPRETMEQQKANANLGSAIKTYVIYFLIVGLLVGIAIAAVVAILSVAFGPLIQQIPGAGLILGLGYLAIIIVPILLIIFGLITSIIMAGIYWVIAKILGGTGTFTENYYLWSRLVWPMLIVQIIVSLLGLIPIVGFLISLVWMLYAIYIAVILISVANKIETIKAVIVVLIPIIITVILVMIMIGAIIASMGIGPAYT